ncbi:MAG: hypothetical protein ACUVWV_03120 [Thermodesulfobacteriota bacterium]
MAPFSYAWIRPDAQACPACWVGYGSGDERYNKPLADLRILYEKEGKAALPNIRETLKKSNDPVVKNRAIEYIQELNDLESIPLLKDMVLELIKRVSFSSFGADSVDFKIRLKAAHALAKFRNTELADSLWEKYARLDRPRKTEVPYLLNALQDPHLTRRLMAIIRNEEDHQLILGAIEVLGLGGDAEALAFLRSKIKEWENKVSDFQEKMNSLKSPIHYSVLKIKAERACIDIEGRKKEVALSQ